MNIKLVLLDVDGTLLPKNALRVDKRLVKAARRLQEAGVKIAIATGRNATALTKEVLGGLRPDYLVCCNGARLMDQNGNDIHVDRMTEQDMYALVDYCEDFDYPLAFVFRDGYYAYVEYQRMKAFYDTVGGFKGLVHDGEDQDRHLEDMPLAAFCCMPPEALPGFAAKYGHLGLKFMAYSRDKFDVGRATSDKAHGMAWLMETLGLTASQVAAVGDGNNDVEMLRQAGLGACVADGAPAAMEAADRVLDKGVEGLEAFLLGLL